MKKITVALALASALALAACASGNPMATTSQPKPSETVVVGSANFPESELLANIYAGALKAKGVNVATVFNIGSRETYVPALKNGEVNVFPEYTGAFALFLKPDADVKDSATALASLKAALPEGLVALEPSKAEDKDSVAVTAETAAKYSLKSVGDLAPVAGQLVLGGPPEWSSRANGVQGLKSVYGLTFKEFKPLDVAGPLTVTALKNGTVQAANLFTTDPAIKANKFVVLDDPKNLFGAQNVIPVVSKSKASETVTTALNAVSAKLDTDTLATLVTKVVVDKADASTVASEWLKAQGLA